MTIVAIMTLEIVQISHIQATIIMTFLKFDVSGWDNDDSEFLQGTVPSFDVVSGYATLCLITISGCG